MYFLPEALDNYVVSHSEQEPELLQQLTRETYQKILQPIMLSGPYQGRVLSMISKLVNPKSILELGTFTGYATLCLAEGLQKDGVIHTIDINEELHDFQRKYFDKSDYGSRIIQHTGSALDIIPDLDTSFDLVFIDGLHTYEQVKKDIINSLNCLKENGVVLVHDCMPDCMSKQAVPRYRMTWNGDVWSQEELLLEFASFHDIFFLELLEEHFLFCSICSPS